MLAETAFNEVKTEAVTPPPTQAKLLGATVNGVGLITAVSAELPYCFALIEDASGRERHTFLADLKRDMLIYPAEAMPYREVRRRIGYGLWSDMLELELVELSDLTHDIPTGCESLGDGRMVDEVEWAA